MVEVFEEAQVEIVGLTIRDGRAPLVNNELAIFEERLDDSGSEVVLDDLRLSAMGTDGDIYYSTQSPAVACDGGNNRYLFVWKANDDTLPLVMYDIDIYGQLFQPDSFLYLSAVLKLLGFFDRFIRGGSLNVTPSCPIFGKDRLFIGRSSCRFFGDVIKFTKSTSGGKFIISARRFRHRGAAWLNYSASLSS